MKEKQNFSDVPYNYPLCLNRQCPKAATCLRQLVEQEVPDNIEFWMVISPKHQSSLKGACPYYRSSAKVRYARGFAKALELFPHKQMRSVIRLLIERFSRRTYYRIRKGERLLSPSEQQDILNIFKQCGITGIQEFDAYVEDYEW